MKEVKKVKFKKKNLVYIFNVLKLNFSSLYYLKSSTIFNNINNHFYVILL